MGIPAIILLIQQLKVREGVNKKHLFFANLFANGGGEVNPLPATKISVIFKAEKMQNVLKRKICILFYFGYFLSTYVLDYSEYIEMHIEKKEEEEK